MVLIMKSQPIESLLSLFQHSIMHTISSSLIKPIFYYHLIITLHYNLLFYGPMGHVNINLDLLFYLLPTQFSTIISLRFWAISSK